MTEPYDPAHGVSGQPYAAPAGESPPWGFDRLPPPTAPPVASPDFGHLLEARSSGSPQWLHIARDVSLTLVCLLLIPILAWVVVTGVRVQNAVNDIGDSFTTPSPTPCTFTPDCPGD